jgi:hypothetical protein
MRTYYRDPLAVDPDATFFASLGIDCFLLGMAPRSSRGRAPSKGAATHAYPTRTDTIALVLKATCHDATTEVHPRDPITARPDSAVSKNENDDTTPSSTGKKGLVEQIAQTDHRLYGGSRRFRAT